MVNDHTNCESPDQLREEGDWIARQFFSPADLQMSPEEYAARHGHRWGCFALHQYRYADPVLGAWVCRLSAILSSSKEIEECRRRFLRPEELAAALRQEAEGL
jgi:hypothetical protein